MSSSPRDTPSAMETLSPRRRELLALLTKGLTNDELATALAITPGTVRIHVSAILAHLGAANRTEATAIFLQHEARPAHVGTVLARPAIALQPLCALDTNARTATIARGLTDDLAALFSRWCWFPVIATTASRRASAQARSMAAAGATLGARFVVDGSVRSIEGGVRIAIRVGDVSTGAVIFADQRDLRFETWLAAQDALCVAIVAAAYPVMIAHAAPHVSEARGPVELTAWELAHQGMTFRAQRDRAANAGAIARFHAALERDASSVLAHFGLGLASYDAVLNQWGAKDSALDALHRSAARCLDLAPHGAEGHLLRARHLQSLGHWHAAIEPLETAIGRNPSFALAHATLAQSLIVIGSPDEALVRMQHAERLGPQSFQAGLATLYFMKSEYVLALRAAEDALATTPSYPFARALAAASSFWLEDAARGAGHLRALRVTHPEFAPTQFLSTFGEAVDSVGRLTHALGALAQTA